MYFTAFGKETSEHPYYQHLYSVRFDGSRLQHLSTESGNHQIYASEKIILSIIYLQFMNQQDRFYGTALVK